MTTSSAAEANPSSTTYWMAGRSTTSSISFGCAFVAGKKRVPRPAAGIRAFMDGYLSSLVPCAPQEREANRHVSRETFVRPHPCGLHRRSAASAALRHIHISYCSMRVKRQAAAHKSVSSRKPRKPQRAQRARAAAARRIPHPFDLGTFANEQPETRPTRMPARCAHGRANAAQARYFAAALSATASSSTAI